MLNLKIVISAFYKCKMLFKVIINRDNEIINFNFENMPGLKNPMVLNVHISFSKMAWLAKQFL